MKLFLSLTLVCFSLAAWAGPLTVSRKFKFSIGRDGAVNKNCLFLSANGSKDWVRLGCNGEPVLQKEVSLEVFPGATNTFRLKMKSVLPNGKIEDVFDSADQKYTSGYDYLVNNKTPSLIDVWINDNADADFHDFRAVLEAPKGVTFVVESLVGHAYAQDLAIEECKNLGTGSEACHWSYYYNDSCLTQKCAKLVVYFAGGQMSCPNPQASPQSYLARYANDGYVAVCARLFENEITSGQFPFHQEARRVDMLLKTITSDPAIMQAWTGERLLLSGVSHGATAAVIAMARNDFDTTLSYWRGSQTTGACFFDGIYDASDNLAKVSSTRVGNSCSIYPRAYGRYCPGAIPIPGPGRPYDPASWPAPISCHAPGLAQDTVVSLPAKNFAIKQWKLIECGSALDYCSQDLVAADPQLQLCNKLEANVSHKCTFGSFPSVSHDNCGASPATMDACKQWFNEL